MNTTSTDFDEFRPGSTDAGEFVFRTVVYNLLGNEIETAGFRFTVRIPGVYLKLNTSITEFNEGDVIPITLETQAGDINYTYNVTFLD